MGVIICPGMHEPELTQQFLSAMGNPLAEAMIFPAPQEPPYSPFHVLDFLRRQLSNPLDYSLQYSSKNSSIHSSHDSQLENCDRFSRINRTWRGRNWAIPAATVQSMPLLFIAFSAGVVGALGAAHGWQWMGGTVKALIAIDGWGVPALGNFPIHRVSHDQFTHWSSAVLGASGESFYAEPARPHLEVWRSPHRTPGQSYQSPTPFAYFWENSAPVPTTLAQFLLRLLVRYQEWCGDQAE